jgi:hypothetical protein
LNMHMEVVTYKERLHTSSENTSKGRCPSFTIVAVRNTAFEIFLGQCSNAYETLAPPQLWPTKITCIITVTNKVLRKLDLFFPNIIYTEQQML